MNLGLRITRNRLLALLGAAIVMGGVFYYHMNTPQVQTSHRMWEVKARFLKNYAITRKLVMTVKELPELPQFENHNKDSWGFPFQIEEDQMNRRYCVVSLGADGSLGGVEENKDLRGCFLLHEQDGSPANPYGNWEKKK